MTDLAQWSALRFCLRRTACKAVLVDGVDVLLNFGTEVLPWRDQARARYGSTDWRESRSEGRSGASGGEASARPSGHDVRVHPEATQVTCVRVRRKEIGAMGGERDGEYISNPSYGEHVLNR